MSTTSAAQTAARVRELKFSDEDFEWYPSTDEIIQVVADSIVKVSQEYRRDEMKSILDIGAGDGRVLTAICKRIKDEDKYAPALECYAIEKAFVHLSAMPKHITVVGTDFHEQTLVDKQVDVVFCNPPYSEFEQWTLRIVREASARVIYLVIPKRWRDSVEIKHALEARSAGVTSLGEFDFENADRSARAKVEIICIEVGWNHRDTFDTAINDMLPELDVFDVELPPEQVEFDRGLVKGGKNLIEVLVDSYDAELKDMMENYRAALRIKPTVLKEIGVSKDSMLSSIRMKIKGLKNQYWKVLFDEIDTVTQRLATKQRASFLESLKNKVTIDFTCNNAYSMLIWVSKWANGFFDQQLIDLFRTLSTDSCVVKYKSNDRVWTKCGWRYNKDYNFSGEGETAVSHYKLEYRIVLCHGGIQNSQWEHERNQYRGLAQRAAELLSDIVTVANNLGFECKDAPRNYEWKSNKQNILKLSNGEPLVAVRAFQNGNMHLHFNPKVMLAINVEAGRLLRWIRNPAEACQELDVKGDEAKQVETMFGSSFRIAADSGFLKLTCSEAA